MAEVSADHHAQAIVTVGPMAFYLLIIRAFPPALLHSGEDLGECCSSQLRTFEFRLSVRFQRLRRFVARVVSISSTVVRLRRPVSYPKASAPVNLDVFG